MEVLILDVLQYFAAGFIRDFESVGAAFISEITRDRDFIRRKVDRHGGLLHRASIQISDRVEPDNIRSPGRDDNCIFREDVDEARVAPIDALLQDGDSTADRRLVHLRLLWL